jgi:ribonuclease III
MVEFWRARPHRAEDRIEQAARGSSEALSRQIGYRFAQPALLCEALTHRSYGVPHNERLEFLGDAILNCVISRQLYERFPRLSEGHLSRLRANLVNKRTLVDIAVSLDLGRYILLGEGELKSGGHSRPSILADTLEAVLGAAFIDGGFAGAEALVMRLFAALFERLDPSIVAKDAKTLLQELLQSRRLAPPRYTVVATGGEAHEQTFRVECWVPELDLREQALGASRRAAEQGAAERVYARLLSHE